MYTASNFPAPQIVGLQVTFPKFREKNIQTKISIKIKNSNNTKREKAKKIVLILFLKFLNFK